MLHLVYEKHWVPSTRIRLRQLQPRLAEAGIDSRLSALPRDGADRDRFAAVVAPGDRVLIHRARPSRGQANWWRSLGVPLIFDFDDAIMFGRKQGLNGALQRTIRGRGFRRMLHTCDAITCGNAFLAEQCDGFSGPIEVLPSAVPTHGPQAKQRDVESDSRGPFRIGWVGRSSNLRYVQELGSALRRVAASREIRLVIVSDAPLQLTGVATEFVPWSLASESNAIAEFDAGVMPLELKGPWSRGKCAYKLLQYMASGVPAVASRVGMNESVIRHGENGLLADSEDSWVEALTSLTRNRPRATQLGRAGRETVLEHYSIEAVGDQLAAFLRQLPG